jgi:hypothetical protein
MKISVLDDYHDTLRTLDCFTKLSGHDVEVWKDHVQDVDALAQRLGETEALVLIRELTEADFRLSHADSVARTEVMRAEPSVLGRRPPFQAM